jgi:hypothetical protein
MTPFKVGDKVRCVNKWHTVEEMNTIYTVANVKTRFPDTYIQLKELLHSAPVHSFDATRYELAAPQPPAEFFYRDLNSAPANEHGPYDTEELAIQAIKDLGIDGNVYEVVERKRIATVKVTRSVDVEVTR